MPKYKLKLEKYTLPDAVKKFYNQEKLSQAKSERDKVRIKIDELNQQIEVAKNKNDKEEVRRLTKLKEQETEKLSSLNKSIYNINAELYDSTVNFNNANIKELNTNISDISSLINNNNKFNSKIAAQISNLLTSQVKLNDIFETKNFKEMLKDIVEKVSKTQNEEVKNKIEEVIQEINDNNNNANENYQAWVGIRDEIKKAIEHQKDCNRFIQLVLEKNIGSLGFDIKNAVDMIKIEGM